MFGEISASVCSYFLLLFLFLFLEEFQLNLPKKSFL